MHYFSFWLNLAWCPQVLSMLQHMSELSSFLSLNDTLLCTYTTFYLFLCWTDHFLFPHWSVSFVRAKTVSTSFIAISAARRTVEESSLEIVRLELKLAAYDSTEEVTASKNKEQECCPRYWNKYGPLVP